MSGRLNVIIGFHSHIPYGTGEDVFERIYAHRLKPFVAALNNFPGIQATLHYSGVVLQWIERVHPEFFMLIGELAARKQVELLGGGFYEPPLPLLHQADKIGQIELFTTYMRKHFGRRPQGCWLPALAWEQGLVGILAACGMNYTFLGEEQFAAAGLSGKALYAPCITEDQGKLITVFPISTALYARSDRLGLAGALEELAGYASGDSLVSFFPRYLSDEKRIHRFFEELSQIESRLKPSIEFTTPGRFCKTARPLGLGKGYFFNSAQAGLFPAMGEAEPLPSSEVSHPRRFLITSPEANSIYSKMMFTSLLINHLRGDKSRKRTAREELWQAQGCDALCSGEVSSKSVRGVVYRALLDAEKITRESGNFIPSVVVMDFDLDGEEEYLFQQEQLNCYIKPAGASVFELDYMSRSWNYGSAFTDLLAFPDFSSLDAGEARFEKVRICGLERFELIELDKAHCKAVFRLSPRQDLPYGRIEIEKGYQLKKDTLAVTYRLANRGGEREHFRFISGFNLSLCGEAEGVKTQAAAALEIADAKNETLISLGSDREFEAWSVNPSGLRLANDVSLESGACWETKYSLRIGRKS